VLKQWIPTNTRIGPYNTRIYVICQVIFSAFHVFLTLTSFVDLYSLYLFSNTCIGHGYFKIDLLSFPQYVIRVGSQLAKDYANYLLLQNFTSPLFIKNPLPQHFSLNATQIAIAQTKSGRIGARVFHVFRSISKYIIALPFLPVLG